MLVSKKTTARDFNVFKRECLRLQKEFGLTDYRLFFRVVNLDSYAAITVSEEGCVATVELSSTVHDTGFDPVRSARHEMIHLLVHRLSWLGGCRHIDDNELPMEEERVVVRLTELLKKI